MPEKFKLHPSGILKIKVKNSKTIYLKTNQTSYVSRNLFWHGSDNYEYTTIFKELISGGEVFFDIGASIGYYSVLAGSINPDIKIYSFEPSEGAMSYLFENLKLNKLLDRSKAEATALSNVVGSAEFNVIYNEKYPDIYNLSGEHNLKTKNELKSNSLIVKTDTLDRYVLENKINTISVMKLDTEATEHLILDGAKHVLQNFRPVIICELLFGKIEDDIEKIMINKDYLFFGDDEGDLVLLDTLSRNVDNGIRNCFFVPKEKEGLVSKFIKK